MQRKRLNTWIRSIVAWVTFSLLLVLPSRVEGSVLQGLPRIRLAAVETASTFAKSPFGDSKLNRRRACPERVEGSVLQGLPRIRLAAVETASTFAKSPFGDSKLNRRRSVLQGLPRIYSPGDEVAPSTVTRPPGEPTQPEGDEPALEGESLDISPSPVPAIQEVATTTAVFESDTDNLATYTAQVTVPAGSLLDRLTRNKPGIWGNKAFYVGLGVVYAVLLVLFFGLVARSSQDTDDAK